MRSIKGPCLRSDFFYFPSYEVVMSGFEFPFADDLRHVSGHVPREHEVIRTLFLQDRSHRSGPRRLILAKAIEIDELLMGANGAARRS